MYIGTRGIKTGGDWEAPAWHLGGSICSCLAQRCRSCILKLLGYRPVPYFSYLFMRAIYETEPFCFAFFSLLQYMV
nr:unknown [Zea mays]